MPVVGVPVSSHYVLGGQPVLPYRSGQYGSIGPFLSNPMAASDISSYHLPQKVVDKLTPAEKASQARDLEL